MSLRNRLALLFFAITAGAIGIVYVYVVPQLESSLRREALRALAADARRHGAPVVDAIEAGAEIRALGDAVRDAADAAGTRVTLLGVTRGTEGLQTYVKTDSTRQAPVPQLRFAIARAAAQSGDAQTGTEGGPQGRIGQAALPVGFTDPRSGRRVAGSVIVFSTALEDVEDDVALIRRRVLSAGAIALLVATLAGLLVARSLARRVRRLERLAGRVAHGDFSARFPVDSSDELGQLARALDHMAHQLSELDWARKRFIATASHELRTPIFSIGGFLELLSDEDVPEEDRRRFLEQVRGQVDRLGKLATDLLDLSKLEAGALELRREPTDLGALARTVSSEFEPALAAHDAHLQVRLPRGTVQVVCDPDRVAQVMRILIDNAITHTPAGTDVVVTANRRDGMARIGVADLGPGIDPAMLARIFEPFATSDDAQGSGLGLAIARELAERMDGHLAVGREDGRTTFTLELPMGPA